MEKSNVTTLKPKDKKEEKENLTTSLSPREIVSELDRFVVGQNKAKRAVAIALRNTKRFLARMFTAFFERHIPASTIAKPAFIKITRIVAIKSHKLLARKAAFNSGKSAA